MKKNSPYYSPLRYPGGKSSLLPFVKEIMKRNHLHSYIEPYAGGAGVALGLLFKDSVDFIYINDLDPRIYSFWKSVVTKTDDFIKLIQSAELSIPEWRYQKSILTEPEKRTSLEIGFATFYLNRCNRSGILLGSGPIGGYDQKGKWKIDARFNKDDLSKRVERIGEYSMRIKLYNCDAIDLITNQTSEEEIMKSLIYFDPPYFEKGQMLYMNAYSPEDHADLSATIKYMNIPNWIMTYDNVSEIAKLYQQYNSFSFNLSYSAASKRKIGKELFIYPDSVNLDRSQLAS